MWHIWETGQIRNGLSGLFCFYHRVYITIRDCGEKVELQPVSVVFHFWFDPVNIAGKPSAGQITVAYDRLLLSFGTEAQFSPPALPDYEGPPASAQQQINDYHAAESAIVGGAQADSAQAYSDLQNKRN